MESRQPKKFSAVFLDDLLGCPSILNYLLTITALEACKLYNRHVNSLPTLRMRCNAIHKSEPAGLSDLDLDQRLSILDPHCSDLLRDEGMNQLSPTRRASSISSL